MEKSIALAIAVFNVIAGGASMAGLYITASSDDISLVTGGIFILTIILSAYILFVPYNPIEFNIREKLQHYMSPDGSGTMTKLLGTFQPKGHAPVDIPFPYPFESKPEVELMQITESSFSRYELGDITPHKFSLKPIGLTSFDRPCYRWVATGKLLRKAADGDVITEQADLTAKQ